MRFGRSRAPENITSDRGDASSVPQESYAAFAHGATAFGDGLNWVSPPLRALSHAALTAPVEKTDQASLPVTDLQMSAKEIIDK